MRKILNIISFWKKSAVLGGFGFGLNLIHQSMFMEYLLCARHCTAYWEYRSYQNGSGSRLHKIFSLSENTKGIVYM